MVLITSAKKGIKNENITKRTKSFSEINVLKIQTNNSVSSQLLYLKMRKTVAVYAFKSDGKL